MAVVQLSPGSEPSDELAAELIAFCRAAPRELQVPAQRGSSATTLPRTEAGKLYKRQLRDESIGDAEASSKKEPTWPPTRPDEALKVDDELEKEFQKALQHELTDDDIERARAAARRRHREQAARAATRSPPRTRSATGRSASATTTRCTSTRTTGRPRGGASQIGHGTMVGHIKTPMLGDPIPDGAQASRRRACSAAIHVFVSGGTWDWYRPLRPGDRIFAFRGEETPRRQEVGVRRALGDPGAPRRRDQPARRGASASTASCACSPSARSRARRASTPTIEPAHYTDDDYERIDAIYAQETAARRREALLGGRQRRRRAAADGEGAAHRSPR